MKIENLLDADNIAEELDDEKLIEIGNQVVEGFESDKESRQSWEERNAEALKLALQVKEAKSFPWRNASNVKYPLVTIACMQFNARAYPALVPGTKPVKHRVIGKDETGEKLGRARRISSHMNFQLTVQDNGWEEDMDRLLMSEALLGTCFKKSYFDADKQMNVSEMVSADNLVLDYFARSVEECRRKTHVQYLHKNQLIEKMRLGAYKEYDFEDELGEDEYEPSIIGQAADEAQGKEPPLETSDDPYTILEQHCWFDLDNDGYEEPYVVTVTKNMRKVLRIKPRYFEENIEYGTGGRVARITPVEVFTKFGFIPSPDGSIYDVGLGILLTPINEAVNSLINQLVDAGTLSNLQSGFIAKGIRIRNGQMRFVPGEWKTTNAMGDDLRKGIFPLPVREPSGVLFNLLGILIEAGQRIGSASDMMQGESPGQNQPAQTTQAVLEQGLKVYSAIIKRNHRSLTSEFRKLFELNKLYTDPQEYFSVIDEGDPNAVFQRDYLEMESNDIAPVSDPNIVSDAQRLGKAEAVRAAAYNAPHFYNMIEVERQYLEALQIDGIGLLLKPEEEIVPPSDPEIELEAQRFQHQVQMDNFKLELDAQETVVNMRKKVADTQRSMINSDVAQGRLELDIAKYVSDAEIQRAELIAKTMMERNKLESKPNAIDKSGNKGMAKQ